MFVLRRNPDRSARFPYKTVAVLVAFTLTSGFLLRIAKAHDFDSLNGGKSVLAGNDLVAARPPRPDKTILEKLVFSGVENVVGVIDKIPNTVLDLVEYPGRAAYDVTRTSNGSHAFRTEPAPIVEKHDPLTAAPGLFPRDSQGTDAGLLAEPSRRSRRRLPVLSRRKRFLPGVDFDLQRAAEEVLLAPLRLANGVGDNFARGLGGLLPPGSAAFPAGSPPPYTPQGYGATAGQRGYVGPAYIVPADVSALPSNGGVFRRSPIGNVDEELPLAIGEGATGYLATNALPVGDLDADDELPLAAGELSSASGFVDYSDWF